MLKMIKQELISSYRQFILIDAIFLAGCILTPWIPQSFIQSLLLLGVSSIGVGLVIILFYNMVRRYQRSLFSKQGYLTLTLPISEGKLIAAKLISAFIWYSLSMLFIVLGLSILMYYMDPKAFRDIFPDLLRVFQFGLAHLNDFLYFWIVQTVTFVELLLSFYAVITLVHTHWFKRYRLALGTVIYCLMLIGYGYLFELVPAGSDLFNLSIMILSSLCLFAATWYLLKKHVELE